MDRFGKFLEVELTDFTDDIINFKDLKRKHLYLTRTKSQNVIVKAAQMFHFFTQKVRTYFLRRQIMSDPIRR